MPSLVEPTLAAGRLSAGVQPVLRSQELVIRPWEPNDQPDLVRAYADPDIQRWHTRSMTDVEAMDRIAQWNALWKQERGVDWAITDGSQVLGRVGLNRVDLHDGLGEVAYWVLPEARGRRVAPRAVSAMSVWAFDSGFRRLELRHSVENPGSCRVAEIAGFELEGTMRQQAPHLDGRHDMHFHALLSDSGQRFDPFPAGGAATRDRRRSSVSTKGA